MRLELGAASTGCCHVSHMMPSLVGRCIYTAGYTSGPKVLDFSVGVVQDLHQKYCDDDMQTLGNVTTTETRCALDTPTPSVYLASKSLMPNANYKFLRCRL